MARDKQDPRSGPDEVGRIVSEIFSFVMANPEAFDASLAEAGAQMTLSRLNKICDACGALPSCDVPQVELIPINEEPIERPKGQEQRRLHLLRLLSCKLSHAFDKTLNPDPLDRQVSIGIDVYLRRLFGQGVYARLNDQAERILLVSGRGDDQVLRAVMGNYQHRQFFTNILVRFGQSFRNFDVARHVFMEDLNESRPLGSKAVGKGAFHTITGALLNDLLLMAKSQDDGALMDFQFGPRTARGLEEVAVLLGKHRREG